MKDLFNFKEGSENSKYQDKVLSCAAVALVIFVVFLILRAGIGNILVSLIALCIFVGWSIAAENQLVKYFCYLCCFFGVLRLCGKIFSRGGLFLTIGFAVLFVIAYIVAGKLDKKEEEKLNAFIDNEADND